MTRGRPFEPGNKLGRGRPQGSRNKRTLLAQKLLEDHSGALMGMAIVKAREDPQMLRMLVGLAVPRRRESPVRIGSLAMKTLEDLDQTSAAILKKAVAGQISWSEAADASAVIETRRQVIETREIAQRVSVLENSGAHGPAA